MSFIPPGKYKVDFMLKDQIITAVIPEEFQDFKVTIIRTPVVQEVSPKIALIGFNNSYRLTTGWNNGYDPYEEVQQGLCSLLPEKTIYSPEFYTWGPAQSQVCSDTRPIDLFSNYLQYSPSQDYQKYSAARVKIATIRKFDVYKMTPTRILGYGRQEKDNSIDGLRKLDVDYTDPSVMGTSEILYSRWNTQLFFAGANFTDALMVLPEGTLVCRFGGMNVFTNGTVVSDGGMACPMPNLNYWKGASSVIIQVGVRLSGSDFYAAHETPFKLTVMEYPKVRATTEFVIYNTSRPSYGKKYRAGKSYAKKAYYGNTYASREKFVTPGIFRNSKRYTFSVFGVNFPSTESSTSKCIFKFTDLNGHDKIAKSLNKRKLLYLTNGVCYENKSCYCLTPTIDDEVLRKVPNLRLRFTYRFIFEYGNHTNYFDTEELQMNPIIVQPPDEIDVKTPENSNLYNRLRQARQSKQLPMYNRFGYHLNGNFPQMSYASREHDTMWESFPKSVPLNRAKRVFIFVLARL
jgi:hypothetical protein